jgi:20S proteasome alpha/beta subunit
MTTIATDGKTMASDGQAEACGTITASRRAKVVKLGDGSLYGSSGRKTDSDALARWLIEGGKKPKVEKLSALRLMPDGVLLYYSETLEPCEVDTPCAVGSGMDFAIGAMEFGASPVEAVKIACKRDPGSGGEITVLAL